MKKLTTIILTIVLLLSISNIYASEDDSKSSTETDTATEETKEDYKTWKTPLAMGLNILPFGVGSWVQGDKFGAIFQTIVDGLLLYPIINYLTKNDHDLGDSLSIIFLIPCIVLNKTLGIFVFPIQDHYDKIYENNDKSFYKEDTSLFLTMSLNILPFGFGSYYQGDKAGFLSLLLIDTSSLIFGILALKQHLTDFESRFEYGIYIFLFFEQLILGRILGMFVFPFLYDNKIENSNNAVAFGSSKIKSEFDYISAKSKNNNFRKKIDKVDVSLPIVNFKF